MTETASPSLPPRPRMRSRPLRHLPTLALAAAAAGAVLPAAAQELSWSTYGTLAYARSDRDFHYLRSIDRSGSASRDTVLGLQGDLRLSPQWAATAQLKLEPSSKADARWALKPAWAFLAWRPDDDWMLRAGRLRLPIYLHSEAMDVGQSHDMARLPAELYTVVPVPDYEGGNVSRGWVLDGGGTERELTVEAFGGRARSTARFWLRDGLPPQLPAGAVFWPVRVQLGGLAVTLRQPDLLLRSSLTRTALHRTDGQGMAVDYPYVALAPGLGYYQVSDALPGPGVVSRARIHNTLFSIGAEWSLGQGWRVTGEFVRDVQHDTVFGADATAGYLALFRQLDRLTPYVSVARRSSRQAGFDWHQRLLANPLPASVPGAATINAAQRVAAETHWLTDQASVALGAAYALTPAVKLKAEWLHTRIGQLSQLVDTPPGAQTPGRTCVNVWSVNLNYAF